MRCRSNVEIAVRSSIIARSRTYSLSLTVGLLKPLTKNVCGAQADIGFAVSVADADYRSEIVRYDVVKSVKNVERAIAASVSGTDTGVIVGDSRAFRHAARPFHIEIRFRNVTGAGRAWTSTGNQNRGGGAGRQPRSSTERGDIGNANCRLPYDRNLFS